MSGPSNPFIAEECRRLGLSQAMIETLTPETYAQGGEDLILEALLIASSVKGPRAQDLYYLDIGANHPVQTSNTYLLYKKHGGHGVLFEADPELIEPLKQHRPRDQVVHAAVTDRHDPTVTLHVSPAKELSSLDLVHLGAFAHMGDMAKVERSIEVPNLHIADLLAAFGQQPIHYLSIDVEGGDLSIMKAIDFDRYRPRFLSCEPSGHIYPNNPQEMFNVMGTAGYAFIARTFVNMIFIDKRWL